MCEHKGSYNCTLGLWLQKNNSMMDGYKLIRILLILLFIGIKVTCFSVSLSSTKEVIDYTLKGM